MKNDSTPKDRIKPILSFRANQFCFEYKGTEYSIVDLCKPHSPFEKDNHFADFYKPYNFELYDQEDVYRFKSPQEAFDAVIKGNYKETK